MRPDLSPVDDGLFASLDPPLLAGSRCGDCGTVVFPVARSCPRCSSGRVDAVCLPDRGTVWTWTVQGFAPKPPYVMPGDAFRPFAVGYVDLGEVLVEARLLAGRDQLRIGLPVRLTLVPAWQEGDAATVTYAFEPDEATA